MCICSTRCVRRAAGCSEFDSSSAMATSQHLAEAAESGMNRIEHKSNQAERRFFFGFVRFCPFCSTLTNVVYIFVSRESFHVAATATHTHQ